MAKNYTGNLSSKLALAKKALIQASENIEHEASAALNPVQQMTITDGWAELCHERPVFIVQNQINFIKIDKLINRAIRHLDELDLLTYRNAAIQALENKAGCLEVTS